MPCPYGANQWRGVLDKRGIYCIGNVFIGNTNL